MLSLIAQAKIAMDPHFARTRTVGGARAANWIWGGSGFACDGRGLGVHSACRYSPDAHDDDAPSQPARLGGARPTAQVGHGHQAQEAGDVVATGDHSRLARSQPEAPLDGRDHHIDEAVHHHSCGHTSYWHVIVSSVPLLHSGVFAGRSTPNISLSHPGTQEKYVRDVLRI